MKLPPTIATNNLNNYSYNGEWSDWLPFFMEGNAGLPLQYMEVDGILYPYISTADQDRSIPADRNSPGRDDDVLLNNFPKSVEYNGWLDYVRNWEMVVEDNPDYPIYVMYYEDMKEDSLQEIEKIVKFLGLNISHDLCKEIADKCKFDNIKKDKPGLEPEFWRTAWRNNKPNFLRKGIVGDWKNWFTVAQNEEFDKLYQEKMKGSKLKIRFEI